MRHSLVLVNDGVPVAVLLFDTDRDRTMWRVQNRLVEGTYRKHGDKFYNSYYSVEECDST